ncbi:MAG TPA: hypothetical protein VMV77_04090 [Bacteroidales bacterium]|nr:hypothetical protein [Bacteroidales bacterium]
METVKFNNQWTNNLFPQGFPIRTTTIISGPGGSGKPLIGYIFASDWLNAGGQVVFLLASTTVDYFKKSMLMLDVDPDNFPEQVYMIELDPTINDLQIISANHIKANFVIPENWDKALTVANQFFAQKENKLGMMVSGAALNLLFFSKTYGQLIHKKIKEYIIQNTDKTLFFSVNSDAFKPLVEELENIVDILLFSEMRKPMTLFLQVQKAKEVAFFDQEVKVPLSSEILDSIKHEAEKGKTHLIPMIKNI